MNTKHVIFLMAFFNIADLQDRYLLDILESNINCFHKINFNVYYITNTLLSSLQLNKEFTKSSHIQTLINMLHFHVSTLAPKECNFFEDIRNRSTLEINKTDSLKNILQMLITEELENLQNTGTKLNVTSTRPSFATNDFRLSTLENNNPETVEDYAEYWSMLNEKIVDNMANTFSKSNEDLKTAEYLFLKPITNDTRISEKAQFSYPVQINSQENNSSNPKKPRKDSDSQIRFDTRRVKKMKSRKNKKVESSQEDDQRRLSVSPFLVSVHMKNEFMCYGSIIRDYMVITAASCLQIAYNNKHKTQPQALFVRVVTHYTRTPGVMIPIIQITFHPGFESETLKHNLAIAKMQYFNSSRLKVEQVKYDRKTDGFPFDVNDVTVLGWVDKDVIDESSSVQGFAMADLKIFEVNRCQTMHPRFYVHNIKNFCAWYSTRNNGACVGDVGGPAVVNGVLVGIISFGPNVCGTADSPTVFTKLGCYAAWIREVLGIERDITAENYVNKYSSEEHFGKNKTLRKNLKRSTTKSKNDMCNR